MKLNNIAKFRYGILLLVFLVISQVSYAVPARPGVRRNINLADGTVINALLTGDEFGHYWLGEDGNGYNSNGDFYERIDVKSLQRASRKQRVEENNRRIRRSGGYSGSKKGLIILVNFSDISFQEGHDSILYYRIANEKNYNEGNFKGSVSDYFYDQSEGQFELTFDVVGPVTVSMEHSYYGENYEKPGMDKRAAEMVSEAIILADDYVDYADYDWNGNKEVDQVFFIFAGMSEAEGGEASTIWPHEWTLDAALYWYGDGPGTMKKDGVRINTYACGSELNYYSELSGIGTICHEFSHCLGYPDYYDTDYSGGQGMFAWDLMDSGSYNGNGFLPSGFTSYERWVAGWKTPIELTDTTYVESMEALQKGGETYVIYNKGYKDEFYLLENRQKVGWDAGIPGSGLLILHVDYNDSIWYVNTVNDDPDHQRMTWVAADNDYQFYIYEGQKYLDTEGASHDPFPLDTINAFNKNTTPAATFYNANEDGTFYLDASVENITQNPDGTISFSFLPYKANETGVIIPRIQEQDDVWYDLTGRRLKGVPTSPGIYIKSGRKVVL